MPDIPVSPEMGRLLFMAASGDPAAIRALAEAGVRPQDFDWRAPQGPVAAREGKGSAPATVPAREGKRPASTEGTFTLGGLTGISNEDLPNLGGSFTLGDLTGLSDSDLPNLGGTFTPADVLGVFNRPPIDPIGGLYDLIAGGPATAAAPQVEGPPWAQGAGSSPPASVEEALTVGPRAKPVPTPEEVIAPPRPKPVPTPDEAGDLSGLADLLSGVQAPQAPEAYIPRVSSPAPYRPGAIPSGAPIAELLSGSVQRGPVDILRLLQAVGGR